MCEANGLYLPQFSYSSPGSIGKDQPCRACMRTFLVMHSLYVAKGPAESCQVLLSSALHGSFCFYQPAFLFMEFRTDRQQRPRSLVFQPYLASSTSCYFILPTRE